MMSPIRSIIVVWVLLVFSCGSAVAVESPTSDPAYVVRGKQTEVRQRALKERLDRIHDAIAKELKRGAPELLPSLEPPPPSVAGYQLLPRIIKDVPPKPPISPQVVSYYWKWSDTLIAQEMAALDRLEATLAKVQSQALPAQRIVYETIVNDYKKVIDDRRLIDSDIDYNWIWQAAIFRDRPSFDRATSRLNEVSDLQKNGKPLTPDIVAAIGTVNPPSFVRIESPTQHQRLIIVPVYTDILDMNFIQKFKKSVENLWLERVGQDDVRVRLEIQTISPRNLYPNQSPPHKGEKIDLNTHVAHFPKEGVVLTTGAAFLRIVPGPALVVSSHDVTPRVLAHEFGHILGFPDAYFRGYRDLDVDGFQIMELVVDSKDLMSSPSSGVIMARHLEALIKALDNR